MVERNRSEIALFMGGVGLISGVISLYALILAGEHVALGFLWPGVFFGYLVSTALSYVGYPLPRHKDIFLAAACSAIGFVTIFAAAFAQGLVEIGSRSDGDKLGVAATVGGTLGAFAVFALFLLIQNSCRTRKNSLLLAARWSFLGGALGVAGLLLDSTVGTAIWYLLHALHASPNETIQNARSSSQLFSLVAVWQAGMAVALSLLLPSPQTSAN